MGDKLRFKSDGAESQQPQAIADTLPTEKARRKQQSSLQFGNDRQDYIMAGTAADYDGGGVTPDDGIIDNDVTTNTADAEMDDAANEPIAAENAESAPTAESKLYERESSLKFVRGDTKPKQQEPKPEKEKSKNKQRRKPDAEGDSATDSSNSNDQTQKHRTGEATSGTGGSGEPLTDDGKLKFAKQEKKISKLEHEAEKNSDKLDKAREKIPTRKKKLKERVYDEQKGKAKTKLRFEKEAIPIGEAKWNRPKKKSLPVKGAATATTIGINALHSKVYQVERENVGTTAAHRAELVGESAYRGGRKLIHSTYRHAKNSPYRKASKLEVKSVKSRMKLDYQKALRDNPKLKSNALSRLMQKRQIKRKYAAALRNAKKSGQAIKKTGSIMTKALQLITKLLRRNPVFLVKAGLVLLLIFAVLSLFIMCGSMLSNTSTVIGAASYSADEVDIELAVLAYSEWETDMRIEILNAETTHSGYDEYRYSIGSIGHNPLQLMAFLTAMYHDFTISEIEGALLEIFNTQYNLEFIPEVEIRTRIETHTDTWEDEDGNSHSESYEVEVEYEWHILNVVLTSVPFMQVLEPLMDDDQTQHFLILMETLGARQIAASPFDFDWLPFVSSYYGYRVHPISGAKNLHRGVDIGLPEGTEIRAGIDGVVTVAAYDSGYGNYIIIRSDDGIELRYAHCHTLLATVGQPVFVGDVIATVGNTGSSTGAHLHMEITRDGVYMNPLFFVLTRP